MDNPVSLRIEGELEGVVQSCDGRTLTARSPKAFPPGRPLSLVLLLPGGELHVETRTIGSKKRPDEHFELRVRLTNVRREARQQLAQAFGYAAD